MRKRATARTPFAYLIERSICHLPDASARCPGRWAHMLRRNNLNCQFNPGEIAVITCPKYLKLYDITRLHLHAVQIACPVYRRKPQGVVPSVAISALNGSIGHDAGIAPDAK